MNEIAAAIGLVQLRRVPEFARLRNANAKELRKFLVDIE
jgi:dTDP-4-amino-4,6-dideoxygalactose transaminase